MTDRISHLFVSLEFDVRTDDIEAISNAIKLIRGVADIKYGTPVGLEEYVARQRVRHETWDAIAKILRPE